MKKLNTKAMIQTIGILMLVLIICFLALIVMAIGAK